MGRALVVGILQRNKSNKIERWIDDKLIIYLRWLSGEEFACRSRRCRRHRFDPWVRKIPWRRKLQPIPMFLPVKFHGQRNQTGYRLGTSKIVGCDWVTEDAHSYWVGLVLRLQLQCYSGRKIFFFLETPFLLLELNRVAEVSHITEENLPYLTDYLCQPHLQNIFPAIQHLME